MKDINKGMKSKLGEKLFSVLGSISEKVADNAMGSCMAAFLYEPEIPEEMIQNMKEED